MPLQNRVTPFGEIVALPGRGLFMGNRGVLHDESRRVVRPWLVKRWISCLLEFRGRYRRVMTPRRYTELFFLDEAAAMSAGHRPCAECRREDYRRFVALWSKAMGGPTNADAIDDVLHVQRVDDQRRKRTYRAKMGTLPDGAFVAVDGRPWLIWRGERHAWSDSGYEESVRLRGAAEVDVLTPQGLIEVLRAGFVPVVHPSAGDRA